MTRKKIVRYTIWNPKSGYERYEERADGSRSWSNFKCTKTMKSAKRWARRMGVGAEIEQVSKSHSGKLYVKRWTYNGD